MNRKDIQKNYECAAFSSAFILRHFGKEADGNELYKKYPRKLLDGTINAKGIIVFFKKLGLDSTYLSGNIDTLKKQITQGIPVILFVRVFPNKRYLHFVPAVGYDEKFIYLVDSLPYTINCNEALYNRKVLISELGAIWKTWIPFCKSSYIVINQKSMK
ncbi:cysteine peptidase family C39 domain-containing protein [Paenibacillus sp. EC2-1]|uniref:cysteine peptidase family C39 domain-containing protein n=1 Tax=Paenibacillus sp. EC2-1 TaxID=3388665 RepID=UPI003BEEC590